MCLVALEYTDTQLIQRQAAKDLVCTVPYMEFAPAQKLCDTCQQLPKNFVALVNTYPTLFWMCNAKAVAGCSGMCVCV